MLLESFAARRISSKTYQVANYLLMVQVGYAIIGGYGGE